MNQAENIAHGNAPSLSEGEYYNAAPDGFQKHIIVIGAGPVGIRFSFELLKRQPNARITVFGNEPYQPYNRVQLSSLLAGEINYDDIITRLPQEESHPNFSLVVSAIRHIDHENKTISDISGNEYPYDKLVIATGSRPHEPNIPGIDQSGVYTFRNLKDAESLYARVSRARHVVVVGGGLLGLESAKALLRFNTKVTVVQQSEHLMNRQLDDQAAGHLQEAVEALGIRVITNSGVRKILGEGRVEGIETRDKEVVECDTVLLCAGIKLNIEIARNAKIRVARGILVNENLETSAEDVYAIGECCEYADSTYGLVNPGYEQAAVLAESMISGNARYVGSLEVSRLKVLGINICSMGNVSSEVRGAQISEIKYQDKKSGIYRKLTTKKGRLIGAVGFGEWNESRRIQDAYQSGHRIWPWQRLRFQFTGNIYGSADTDNVNNWPKSTIVCQCNNLSQGELVEAIDNGASTLAELQKNTSAGTVCGSCKPLLSQLVGYTGPSDKEKAWPFILMACLTAAIVAFVVMLVPEMQVSDSVQTQGRFEAIWNDKFWKQVTGFSLLGMSALGLLMSLRKKLSSKRLGEYAYWRILHITLGVLCAGTLILHTGFHLGSNFNQILMIDFIGILLLGSLAGAILSLSHKFSASTGQKIKKFWTWAHIFFTWPLPILLAFHILTVYYF